MSKPSITYTQRPCAIPNYKNRNGKPRNYAIAKQWQTPHRLLLVISHKVIKLRGMNFCSFLLHTLQLSKNMAMEIPSHEALPDRISLLPSVKCAPWQANMDVHDIFVPE